MPRGTGTCHGRETFDSFPTLLRFREDDRLLQIVLTDEGGDYVTGFS